MDGIIYAIGGHTSSSTLATVEAYDPKTNHWTTKASMPVPRAQFGIGVLKGQIYVVGGTDGNQNGATVMSYNPKKDRWKMRAPMPTARVDLAAAAVNGLLYAAGGLSQDERQFLATVEAYKP